MRSRSSLLSHILGSNPHISGYSELSVIYRDRLSYLEQVIKIHQDGLDVNSSIKLFDKILHNSFDFKNNVALSSSDIDVLIMLRPPEPTIRSIVTMGQKNNNKNYSDIEWACKYYQTRVNKILAISEDIGRYYFLESDDIINHTSTTLENLSSFLGLDVALTSEYGSFNKTGMKKSGDTSENIKKGKIIQTRQNDSIEIPNETLDSLNMLYLTSVASLRAKSQ
jgi:hypothetical protein